jgi:hypothetical protein
LLADPFLKYFNHYFGYLTGITLKLQPTVMPHDEERLDESQLSPVCEKLRPATNAFAGRIGGNQDFVLDRSDPRNAELLKTVPDAAPLTHFRDAFDFHGFVDTSTWKYAFVEGVGMNDHPPRALYYRSY